VNEAARSRDRRETVERRVSPTEGEVVVMTAQPFGSLRLLTALDGAGPPSLGVVLPIVEERCPPGEVLLTLVRGRQVFVHEGHHDGHKVPDALHLEHDLVVVVGPTAREIVNGADTEE
jgi:hypothetical protein